MANSQAPSTDPAQFPGYEPVDGRDVERVRAAVDTTSVDGTDTEFAPVQIGSPDRSAAELTRSEEQLQVRTERVAAGRVRLERYVVTEDQVITVPVTHDEVRIVREPIPEGTILDDLPADNGTAELILTEERIVVTTVVVPVERVRISAESVTEDRDVTAAVRKERIEYSAE